VSNSRGEFKLTRRSGVKITRGMRVGKTLDVQEEILHAQSEAEVLDALSEGLDPDHADMSMGLSGFGKMAGNMGQPEVPNPGDPLAGFSPEMRALLKDAGPRDLTTILHGGLHFDEPDSDILMQPDTTPPREEGDFVDTDAPKRRNQTDQGLDPADAWDMLFYDETNDRNMEQGHNGPMTFERSPGERRPKASTAAVDAELDAELDGLFE